MMNKEERMMKKNIVTRIPYPSKLTTNQRGAAAAAVELSSIRNHAQDYDFQVI